MPTPPAFLCNSMYLQVPGEKMGSNPQNLVTVERDRRVRKAAATAGREHAVSANQNFEGLVSPGNHSGTLNSIPVQNLPLPTPPRPRFKASELIRARILGLVGKGLSINRRDKSSGFRFFDPLEHPILKPSPRNSLGYLYNYTNDTADTMLTLPISRLGTATSRLESGPRYSFGPSMRHRVLISLASVCARYLDFIHRIAGGRWS